eukprot:scaffold62003_cov14-Prasinocladus_malaysianus.AAC.1
MSPQIVSFDHRKGILGSGWNPLLGGRGQKVAMNPARQSCYCAGDNAVKCRGKKLYLIEETGQWTIQAIICYTTNQ